MKRIIPLLFVLLTHSMAAVAQSRAAADSAYARKDYAAAAATYEQLVRKVPAADVYYNLANAYFRMDKLPEAVLNYERAHRLDPSDEDTRYNLALCRSRLTDRFGARGEMFFVTFTRNCMEGLSPGQWMLAGILCFACTLLLAGLYLFGGRVWLRKAGFFGALACLAGTVVSNAFAYARHRALHEVPRAVVFRPSQIYASPVRTSAKVKQLHEGTVVEITDTTQRGWWQVEMPDGARGWLVRQDVERI